MNQRGISLISLVVTVIVVMIIAAISLYDGQTTPEMANRSVFMQEIDDLRVELGILRANHFAETGNADEGFELVMVYNAPEEFVSVSEDINVMQGYLIDFNELDKSYYGNGTLSVAGQVHFGKDDVFVYDKNGTVYYAAGFEDQDTGEVYYNSISHKSK